MIGIGLLRYGLSSLFEWLGLMRLGALFEYSRTIRDQKGEGSSVAFRWNVVSPYRIFTPEQREEPLAPGPLRITLLNILTAFWQLDPEPVEHLVT